MFWLLFNFALKEELNKRMLVEVLNLLGILFRGLFQNSIKIKRFFKKWVLELLGLLLIKKPIEKAMVQKHYNNWFPF